MAASTIDDQKLTDNKGARLEFPYRRNNLFLLVMPHMRRLLQGRRKVWKSGGASIIWWA